MGLWLDGLMTPYRAFRRGLPLDEAVLRAKLQMEALTNTKQVAQLNTTHRVLKQALAVKGEEEEGVRAAVTKAVEGLAQILGQVRIVFQTTALHTQSGPFYLTQPTLRDTGRPLSLDTAHPA
eukprot:9476616-Pyramimonas_sp.AAC.1